MCHPGRPGPHGESHSGSPGFAAFQSAKSIGLRFGSSTSTRAPGRLEQLLERAVRQLAVAGEASDVEVHALAVDDVRVAGVDELGDQVEHPLDVLGGVREWSAARTPSRSICSKCTVLEPRRDLGLGGASLGGPAR